MYKPIPNFTGYFAGKDGHIYSNWPRGTEKGLQPLRKLSANIQSSGKYYIVSVKKDGDVKHKTQRVHRLVCMAFSGLPENPSLTASHIDGNWKNNVPSNITWETYSQNLSRKKIHGTDDVGTKNSRAKISTETLLLIRNYLKNSNLTHLAISKIFGLNRVFITKIANGHRYKGQ